ncbi:hypothetical protein B484DRAFT_405397, partial [Ochromonadaceae sp. CCMP2298]
NGAKELLHKPRRSQRKETLVGRPCHPECEGARLLIKAGGATTAAAVNQAAQGLLALLGDNDTTPDDQP